MVTKRHKPKEIFTKLRQVDVLVKRLGRLSWKCMVGLLRHWAWLCTVAVAEGGGLEPPHENYPMTD